MSPQPQRLQSADPAPKPTMEEVLLVLSQRIPLANERPPADPPRYFRPPRHPFLHWDFACFFVAAILALGQTSSLYDAYWIEHIVYSEIFFLFLGLLLNTTRDFPLQPKNEWQGYAPGSTIPKPPVKESALRAAQRRAGIALVDFSNRAKVAMGGGFNEF